MTTGPAKLERPREPRLAVAEAAAPPIATPVQPLRRWLRASIALMKPGIIWLLLVTTVPAMILATGDWPDWGDVALVLLGGVLTSGGANALNQWFDRDIDRIMKRTQHRPLPQAQLPPGYALLFGISLVVLGGVQLAVTINLLSAALAVGAAAFYVLVYTMWLKRWTVQNIVIGGAAGAVPPMVGWAAVRNDLDVAPVLLFLIVFLWTPPHFWALALKYQHEYAAARVPMLPVVQGDAATKRQIFGYSVVLAVASLGLVVSGDAGWLYGVAAGVLGVAFAAQSWRLLRGAVEPMALFFLSIAYLPLLFLAVALDELVL